MDRLIRHLVVSCLALAAEVGPRPLRVIAADTSTSQPGVDPAAWTESYDEALKKAKADNKWALADFTGSDWCHNCVQLKREVLDTPGFRTWAAGHVVLLELDFPQRKRQPDKIKSQNARLKEEFKVEMYPTVVILNADGKEVGRIVGYQDAKAWAAELHKAIGGPPNNGDN